MPGVSNESFALLEGVWRQRSTGDALATFAASAQLDQAGLVSRYLAYLCMPAVVRGPSVGDEATPGSGGQEVLGRYFCCLADGDLDAAAACFAADALFSHPPFGHAEGAGDHRVECHGRDEVRAPSKSAAAGISARDWWHPGQQGSCVMVEGVAEGLPASGSASFVLSLTLDGQGLIERHVSFASSPATRRL